MLSCCCHQCCRKCVLLLFAAFSTAAPLEGSADYLPADEDSRDNDPYTEGRPLFLAIVLTLSAVLLVCIPSIIVVTVVCSCHCCMFGRYLFYGPYAYHGRPWY
uniref:Secreted protein n=1 Tax=Steinernema glaseri TaxID=37863 RepID=A0A1I7YNZ6_9BILA